MTKMVPQLRAEIDAINLELLKLIDQRFCLVDEMKKDKVKRDTPLYDPEREAEMLKELSLSAGSLTHPEPSTELMKLIIAEYLKYMKHNK